MEAPFLFPAPLAMATPSSSPLLQTTAALSSPEFDITELVRFVNAAACDQLSVGSGH
jgi:hypothetical protein